MPLFEYRCSACAHLEEVLQKHGEPAPATCPACGKSGSLAKELSLTSFQLKGGGWYKDLYASSGPASKADSSSSSSDSKTESKVDTKKDSGPSSNSSSSSGSASGGSSSGSSGGGSSASATSSAAT